MADLVNPFIALNFECPKGLSPRKSKATAGKSALRKQKIFHAWRETKATEHGMPLKAWRGPSASPYTGDQTGDRRMKPVRSGVDTHLAKGTLSDDAMEIKVVQINFAFKVYRGGETTAHISLIAGGGER